MPKGTRSHNKRLKTSDTTVATIHSDPLKIIEMRHHIFYPLPAETIAKMGLMSREWKAIIRNNPVNAEEEVSRLLLASDDERKSRRRLLINNSYVQSCANPHSHDLWGKALWNLCALISNEEPYVLDAEITFKTIILLDDFVTRKEFLNLCVERLNNPLYSLKDTEERILRLNATTCKWEMLLHVLLIFDINLIDFEKVLFDLEYLLAKESDARLKNRINNVVLMHSYLVKKDWIKLRETIIKTPVRLNLCYAVIEDANLDGLTFDVNLSQWGARIINSSMKGIMLDANFFNIQAVNSTFCKANLQNVTITNSDFNACDFTDSTWIDASIRLSRFKNITAPHAGFLDLLLAYNDFEECNFSHADLTDLTAFGNDFTNIDLRNAKLNNAFICSSEFFDINFSHANLTNALIMMCDFSDEVFDGANFTGTCFLYSSMSEANRQYAKEHGAVFDLPSYIRTLPNMIGNMMLHNIYSLLLRREVVNVMESNSSLASLGDLIANLDLAKTAEDYMPHLEVWLDKFEHKRYSPRLNDIEDIVELISMLKEFLAGCQALAKPAQVLEDVNAMRLGSP